MKSRYKIAISATPIEKSPKDLFQILHYLDPKTWNNRWKYLWRYCSPTHNGFGYNFDGHSNEEELSQKLRSTIMIRRNLEDVQVEMPSKVRQLIGFPSNESDLIDTKPYIDKLMTMKANLEIAKCSDNKDDYRKAVEALKLAKKTTDAEIFRVRHETAKKKVPFIIEYIKNLIEEGETKLVLFAYHVETVIMELHKAFKKNSVYISGSCSSKERQNAIDRFHNDPKINIFIGSIKIAGEGIDLIAGNWVGFVELDDLPSVMYQCESRLQRIISKFKTIFINLFVMENSTDAKIAKNLIERQDSIDKALGDVEIEIEKDEPIIPIEGITTTKQRIKQESKLITPEPVSYTHLTLPTKA